MQALTSLAKKRESEMQINDERPKSKSSIRYLHNNESSFINTTLSKNELMPKEDFKTMDQIDIHTP